MRLLRQLELDFEIDIISHDSHGIIILFLLEKKKVIFMGVLLYMIKKCMWYKIYAIFNQFINALKLGGK